MVGIGIQTPKRSDRQNKIMVEIIFPHVQTFLNNKPPGRNE